MTDEQIDSLYRDFFRREMPGELPPLRKSERPSRRQSISSRYVLAASILALLGLGLLLTNALKPDKPYLKSSATGLLKESEADGKRLLETLETP